MTLPIWSSNFWRSEFVARDGVTGTDDIQPKMTVLADNREMVGSKNADDQIIARAFNTDGTPYIGTTANGAAIPIDVVFNPDQALPDVAADDQGGFAVVWEDSPNSGNGSSPEDLRFRDFNAAGNARRASMIMGHSSRDPRR